MRRIAAAAALCLVACGTEPSTPPAPPALAVVPGPVTTCQSVRSLGTWLSPNYPCGAKVLVTSTNTQLSGAIPGAIAIWESVVFGQNGFPDFVTSGTFNFKVTVVFDPATPTGTWFCGTTGPNGTTTITVHRGASQTTCNGNFTNAVQASGLSRLLAHELTHAIGYKHLSDAGQRRPILDHCVASLPPSHDLNGGNCQAEIELARYMYGTRATDPDITKHFATGFDVSGTPSALAGASSTLTVGFVEFLRAAPSLVQPAASTLTYAWSSDNTAIAQPSPGTGNSNAIQGVAAGSTTIRIRLTGSTYEQAEPMSGSAIPFTVITAPPPPTGLAAGGVTASAATITWVNGATTNTTTTLQYRKNGATTWTTASSTIAGGATSFVLGGLAPLTTYDVRMWHVRDGLSSTITTKASLFTTTGFPTISGFHVTNCVARQEGLKTYNYFTMGWTSSPNQIGGNFQIGLYHTSDVTQASVILTVSPLVRSAEVGGYTAGTLLSQRWFWIRHISAGVAGPWVPLAENPLATNVCAFN
jgi:hypothetical protein